MSTIERDTTESPSASEDAIDRAVRRAARSALLAHKRAGTPVVTWRDGRVVLIPPDEILAGEEPAEPGD